MDFEVVVFLPTDLRLQIGKSQLKFGGAANDEYLHDRQVTPNNFVDKVKKVLVRTLQKIFP